MAYDKEKRMLDYTVFLNGLDNAALLKKYIEHHYQKPEAYLVDNFNNSMLLLGEKVGRQRIVEVIQACYSMQIDEESFGEKTLAKVEKEKIDCAIKYPRSARFQ